MKKEIGLIFIVFLIGGCSHHKDDAPIPSSITAPTSNPPAPNPCDRGGTIILDNNGGLGSASFNNTAIVQIHNFMPSCGDTIAVSMSPWNNPNQWNSIVQWPTAQPNWYSIGIGSVTIHNGAGISQNWEYSATER